MCSEAECELAASRMPNRDDFLSIDPILVRILDKKLIGRANVAKRAGPPAALVADSAIFKIRCHQSLDSKRGTKMSRMIEVEFRAPVSPVNVDYKRMWFAFIRRQPQIEELIRVRAVRDPRVGLRRLTGENFVGHGTILRKCCIERQ